MAGLRNVMVLGLCEGKTLNFNVDALVSVREIKERVRQRRCVDVSLFTLSRGGVILDNADIVGECDVTVLHAHSLLKGGKGGFGSLIRAMGSQINKSTNKEACRNLGGRRVRDINAEKKLAKWAAEEPERKRKEAEERRQRLARKRAGPKHTFDDSCYMEQIKSTEEEMGGALKQGLEASAGGSSKGKAKAIDSDRPRKRPKLWLGVEEDELSESEDEREQASDIPQGLDHPLDEDNGLSDKSEAETDADLAGPSTNLSANGSSEPCCSSSIAGSIAADSVQELDKSSSKNEQLGQSPQVEEEQSTPNNEEESTPNNEPIDLSKYESVEELICVGGERLKITLQSMGLKCGGTLEERARRLFSTKGKTKEQFDPSLFAKSKKTKRKDK